jgi:hypothetical protein
MGWCGRRRVRRFCTAVGPGSSSLVYRLHATWEKIGLPGKVVSKRVSFGRHNSHRNNPKTS